MERNDFASLLANENNTRKTFTENSAVAYATSGKRLLDFNFKLSQYRNMHTEDIKDDFTKAFFEDPIIATKFVFYVGDIRGGLGERKVFNTCIEWLADNKPEIALAVIKFIPEYTRWDNLIRLIDNKNVSKEVFRIIKEQLRSDMINMKKRKNISLCAKWMPSIQSKKPEDRKLAFKLEEALGFKGNHKAYRKLLAELRDKLNIIEKNLSQKTLEEVDFSKMTSKQMLKYSNKLQEEQSENFNEYLEKVATGEAKMNSSVNTPADIVHMYTENYGWSPKVKPYDLATEMLWKNLKDTIGDKDTGNTIVIRDGSGSMTCKVSDKTSMTCLEVCTALSIYCAEKLKGEYSFRRP